MKPIDLGLFLMPSHPPERSIYDGQDWDLRVIELADRLGYREAWIGEHINTPWEPCPNPELVVAQALRRTEQIVLAPGAHILPNHHPGKLAQQVAYLDHLARGRYMLGIGTGGGPVAGGLFGYAWDNPAYRGRVRECLEIMIKLWTEPGPWEYQGQHWSVKKVASAGDPDLPGGRDLVPYQQPYPPLGMAGLSAESDTIKLAGEFGGMPLSLNLSLPFVHRHWRTYTEAAEIAGRTPSRDMWRIGREVMIADSDDEAVARSAGSAMGRMTRDYFLPIYRKLGRLPLLKHDESVADADVTPEYLARTEWLVGSEETVAERLMDLYAASGGFGTLIVVAYDYADDPGPWLESMQRLAQAVLPRVNAWIGAEKQERTPPV